MDYYQNNSTTPGAFLFLDFKKAFDCVSHDAMNITLKHLGFPPKLCDLIKNLYSTSSTRLVVNDELTDTIPISRGTRQGCPLSPLIYAIIAELRRLLGSVVGKLALGREAAGSIPADRNFSQKFYFGESK